MLFYAWNRGIVPMKGEYTGCFRCDGGYFRGCYGTINESFFPSKFFSSGTPSPSYKGLNPILGHSCALISDFHGWHKCKIRVDSDIIGHGKPESATRFAVRKPQTANRIFHSPNHFSDFFKNFFPPIIFLETSKSGFGFSKFRKKCPLQSRVGTRNFIGFT